MKKQFNNFAIIWLCGVVLFSTVVLLVNISAASLSVAFWVAYAFVLLAFAGQMLVAYKFFNEENKDKVFLNMPLMVLSRRCVIVSFVVGTALMVIPKVPYFVAPIVAVLILVLYTVAIVKAKMAGEAVEAVGQKVAVQTAFIKDMTVKAETVVSSAKTDATKEIATKVYEAFRYSNKSSHGGLDEVEAKISANYAVFADAITSGDDDLAKSVGEQLIKLIADRNAIAKANK